MIDEIESGNQERSEITDWTYTDLSEAYGFFNTWLFDGTLPDCLITYQRKSGARGYYSNERFELDVDDDDPMIIDEIALNPKHFRDRSRAEILSTLVHEMAHQWQAHFGQPSRGGYHNKEWADKMESIGLMPSMTGQPGGRRTGPKVTHYIVAEGQFDIACNYFLSRRCIELPGDQRDDEKARKKAESKTRYTCPGCHINAWAKPKIVLLCGECAVQMMA